jgi:iron-sulfur cluster repair protein YtfE (RIC family)
LIGAFLLSIRRNGMEFKLEYITGTDSNGEEIVEQKTFVTNKIKARLVRSATEITQGVDFNNLTPESLDKLIDFVCEVYKFKFTRDELYDGLDADKLIPTLFDTIQGITAGVTSRLETFPSKQ